jgi:manganese transport protein
VTVLDRKPAWRRSGQTPSLAEVHRSIRVPASASVWRKLLAFTGPGLLVAVGYMDPGNWATDLEGGAKFGYTLLSVILISNLMAILLQHLALKLGVVTGRDLAQACRDHYSRPTTIALWLICEVAIAACDLAEVLGSAVALKLLFGIPYLWGVLLTSLDVMVVLLLQHKGFRVLEALVGGLIVVIGGCFAYELIASRPDLPAVLRGLMPVPEIVTDSGKLFIAIGILGATVMPHNLYLHSSIVQTRAFERDDAGKKMAVKYGTIDSTVSLLAAFFINAAILILAASAFHWSGHQDVATIERAHELLPKALGATLASALFAIALLASGQNSTLTGTLAGQIVMEGFLDLRLRPWVRRLLTRLIAIVPAVIVVALARGKQDQQQAVTDLLILSQVILSMQLSFAVVPLVLFTSDKRKMGEFANTTWLKAAAWLVTATIIALNGYLLWDNLRGWLKGN